MKKTNLVTEGISGKEAAFAAGITVFTSNTEEARLVNTLRRSKLFWCGLEEECNCVVVEDFGVMDEIVENDETVIPSIEEVTAANIVSGGRNFMVWMEVNFVIRAAAALAAAFDRSKCLAGTSRDIGHINM